MKRIIHSASINMKRQLFLLCGFWITVFFIMPAKGQAQSDSNSTKINTYAPLIEFKSIQKNDNSIDLRTSVKAKINGQLLKLTDLKIEFFAGSDSASKKLGEAYTDGNGVAIFNCKADQLASDKDGKLNFKTLFAGKDSIEPAQEVLAIKRARLDITPVKEDSVLSVKVKLIDLSTGKETPVPATDLGVFVKRLFSALKLGDGKTDESGEANVEIPNNIPGDAKGNITLIAKVEDNETYGNLEATTEQQWGTPVSYELKELPRALWSTHPPIWMMVTFAVLVTAVWGHYIVIIVQLFRLRKEEPEPDPDTQAV